MLVRRGIAVSPGVAIGRALVFSAEGFRIPQNFVSVDAVEAEIARFHVALGKVHSEIERYQQLARDQLGEQYSAIFGAHLQMARDAKLIQEIESLIRDKCYSPEFASSRVLRRYAKVFQNLDSHYLAERADDIFDLEKRILRHLLGKRREGVRNLTAPVLVLAHNLTPSETAGLNRQFVLGFATEVGGAASHTAILAGALEIPAVVGVGYFLSDVTGGETVIIDGNHGEVIVDPDESTLAEYRDSAQRFRIVEARRESLLRLPAVTKDGERIRILGNIEFPEEVEHCTQRGAEGVGLYRTEFLYLEAGSNPTEEDHFEAYRRVISAFPDGPVIIRTLDLGADKVPSAVAELRSPAANPALCLRSIRLSLQNLELFKTQLRAVFRAAIFGDVRIMFPMITTVLELRQAKMVVSDVIEDLEEHNVPFKRDVPLGMMVEVPAAALLVNHFAEEVDFFSIGTNDLIQYTLAADRSDPSVANLYRAGDPAILRLIEMVVDAGRKHDKPVTVCGQMSSDPMFLPLLIGLGIRHFSVTPHSIPEIKEVVRALTIAQAEEIVAHVRTLEVARNVEDFLRGELKKICPDLML